MWLSRTDHHAITVLTDRPLPQRTEQPPNEPTDRPTSYSINWPNCPIEQIFYRRVHRLRSSAVVCLMQIPLRLDLIRNFGRFLSSARGLYARQRWLSARFARGLREKFAHLIYQSGVAHACVRAVRAYRRVTRGRPLASVLNIKHLFPLPFSRVCNITP